VLGKPDVSSAVHGTTHFDLPILHVPPWQPEDLPDAEARFGGEEHRDAIAVIVRSPHELAHVVVRYRDDGSILLRPLPLQVAADRRPFDQLVLVRVLQERREHRQAVVDRLASDAPELLGHPPIHVALADLVQRKVAERRHEVAIEDLLLRSTFAGLLIGQVAFEELLQPAGSVLVTADAITIGKRVVNVRYDHSRRYRRSSSRSSSRSAGSPPRPTPG
jgi:hypothetical protein